MKKNNLPKRIAIKLIELFNSISNSCLLRLFIITVGTLLLTLILLCTSCKTTSTTDKTHTTTHINEQITQQLTVDTITQLNRQIIEFSDNTHTNNQTKSIIKFTPNGGRYNHTTGEFTGVLEVQHYTKEQELKNIIEQNEQMHHAQQTKIQLLTDSITELHHNQQNDITVTEKEMNWWRWLLSGMAIGAALIIFLKKFPYTQPFFFWL